MKAIIFIIFITIILTPAAWAVDSTPSADIKSKLEELKKEIASKAAKLKGEVKRKLQNKAYVGTLKTKSSNSLTLASSTGPKLVSINQDTLLPKKSLAEENYVAALGDVDDTGVLTAKKVILLNPKPYLSEGKTSSAYTLNPKTYLWGQVVSISDKLLTLKDRSLKNIALSLPSGSKAKLNDFIIATGQKNKNDIFEAEFVYVIPR